MQNLGDRTYVCESSRDMRTHARPASWLLLALLAGAACASARTSAPPPTCGSGQKACDSRWPAAQRDQIAAVQPDVEAAARTYKLDPRLINAVIWVESKFDPNARGPGGTQGLMQLMPATARELAERLGERSRPLDPGFNIRAGSLYLSRMVRRFGGDVRLGLAAYHRGAGHVAKWQQAGGRGVPEGSRKYVDKVFAAQKMF